MTFSQNGDRPGAAGSQSGKITPELVQQVADRVMALWYQELRLARERQPWGSRRERPRRQRGGGL